MLADMRPFHPNVTPLPLDNKLFIIQTLKCLCLNHRMHFFSFLVWSDIRTDTTVDQILSRVPDNDKNSLMPLCGLPISPYFSAIKIRWLIDNVPAVRKAIRSNRCYFGTVDSWIVWVIYIYIKIIFKIKINIFIDIKWFQSLNCLEFDWRQKSRTTYYWCNKCFENYAYEHRYSWMGSSIMQVTTFLILHLFIYIYIYYPSHAFKFLIEFFFI